MSETQKQRKQQSETVLRSDFDKFCTDCNAQLSNTKKQLIKAKSELKRCHELLKNLEQEKDMPVPDSPKKTKSKSSFVTPEVKAKAAELAIADLKLTRNPTGPEINQYLRLAYEFIHNKKPPAAKPKSECTTNKSKEACELAGCKWVEKSTRMINDPENPGNKKPVTVNAHCVMTPKSTKHTTSSIDELRKILKQKERSSKKQQQQQKQLDSGESSPAEL